MAASIGIVPTLPNANQGESSRLLRDDEATEIVHLDEAGISETEGVDFVPKLKKRVVWVYGIGETGVWASHVIVGFYLNTFLLEVAGVAPSDAGNVLLICEIWDALINPVIGTLSDSLTTRWGRRRPWIILSALPFSLAYFAIWMVWPDGPQKMLFAYYTLIYLCFTTASNCMAVPFTALTSDLAETYDQATELTQARMLCNLVTGVLCSFGHSFFVELFTYKRSSTATNYRMGYLLSAFVMAILFIVPPIVVFFGIKEKPFTRKVDADDHKPGLLNFLKRMAILWKNVFSTLLNVPFALLTAFYFLSWTAVQTLQNNLYLYDKYVLRRESNFMWILLLIQLVAAASLFFWSLVSRKIGKRFTFILGLSFWFVTSIGSFWMSSKTPLWVIYVVCTISAFGASVTFLIPWSMIPDIIDADEVKTGVRREGVFYSLFVLFQKVGLAIALSASSYALSGAGYISPAAAQPDTDPLYQPPSVILTLKLVNGPIPGILVFLAMIISFFYPLGRAKVAENAEILKRLRAESADKQAKFTASSKDGNVSDVPIEAEGISTLDENGIE